jgi:hypothetical protein
MYSEILLLGWFCHLTLSMFLLQVGTFENHQLLFIASLQAGALWFLAVTLATQEVQLPGC